jgi:phosphopantetheinyl transferase
MPLVLENDKIPDTSTHIWKITEPAEYFINSMPWNNKQLEWLDSIHPVKKIEYLASRYLIYKITGKLDSHLYKDEAGKLYLNDSNKNLSLSHSSEWIGLALSKHQVGFDLQKLTAKIQLIAHRFLNKTEYEWLQSKDDDQLLIIAWTIKEAVYKAHGKKGILFSQNILLQFPDQEDKPLKITTAILKMTSYEKSFNIYHGWKENFGWALALEN